MVFGIPAETLLAFIPIALALNLTPGPDMLFCLAQGSHAGAKGGIAASIGVSTGALIHTIIAGLGLAVVLSAYAIAFEILRWSGVVYLLYLALALIRKPTPNANDKSVTVQRDLFRIWRSGTIVCLLNPKMILFVLALIPQFVDPRLGSVFLQFMVFGLIIIFGGTIINALVGVFAGRLVTRITANGKLSRLVQWITSLLFVGLAIRLALDDNDYTLA